MADQSLRLPDPRLQARLGAAIDREGKIPAALASLAPVEGHRVLLIDPDSGLRERQLAQLGGRVTSVRNAVLGSVPSASADVVVACWSAIRPGEEPAARQVGETMRILAPTGRLVVVHDYGRDDVSDLLGSPAREAQLVAWSHREGPFLVNGFKLRVLHCWWSWDTLEEATEVLAAAFGEAGARVAAAMRRPRLAYKVAVYHRDHERATLAPGAAA
ncbi:MAG: hypothetical protein U0869_19270 [Chloroflexota bacterium]